MRLEVTVGQAPSGGWSAGQLQATPPSDQMAAEAASARQKQQQQQQQQETAARQQRRCFHGNTPSDNQSRRPANYRWCACRPNSSLFCAATSRVLLRSRRVKGGAVPSGIGTARSRTTQASARRNRNRLTGDSSVRLAECRLPAGRG